jgi:tetratricopeptide (TPR) repeat protein
MNKLRILTGFVLAACVIAGLALSLCEAAEKNNAETSIRGLSISVKGDRTCLIFDAAGAKPKQIGPASPEGISVFFTHITAKLADKVIADRKAAAREVKFRRESGFFEVLFREKNVSVSSKIRDAKNGRYSLTLELTRSGKSGGVSAEAQTTAPDPNSPLAAKPVEKTPSVELKKLETSELFNTKAAQQLKDFAATRPSQKPDGSQRTGGSTSQSRGFAETDAKALELYTSADEQFENCSRNLVGCATDIIEAYDEALKACPQSSHAPLAVYRKALAHSVMGNYARADKLFRQVESEWPDDPVVARCWIGIGDIYNKRQGYLEAMEAFRTAQRVAVEGDDKAAADYELGKVFLILGANKEALEMLNRCISQAPDYYTKKPDVFRFIGEAFFGLANIEKSKEYLFRYINCQQTDPDQDMVLAKIAEIFLAKGDLNAANKMYSFIGKYYTDSEGDLICRIRKGELTEKTTPDAAIKIYDDLCSKDLSPGLRRIVLMKLAALNLKRSNPAHSLELLDEAFPVANDVTSSGEPAALRERILCELIRQYFSDKEFIKVVQLHEKYQRVVESLQSPAALEQVAESYAELKFYSDAIAIYDRLFAKGQKKDEALLLRCAVYALRINDDGRSFQFCRLVQNEALDLKKSEILGHIFYRDQKYADALKYFGKVSQKGKEFEFNDPNSLYAYGCSLYQTKKFDEAIPVLQMASQSIKTDDADARRSILVTLGKCFAEQKQYEKAAEMMEAAKQFSGEDASNELLYESSKLYIAAGMVDKAIQNLNQLKSTEHPFWAAVAQQQLNTIDMSRSNPLP